MRWAVIGGGVLGMSVAQRLATAGEDVVLVEAAPELGGLASPWTLAVPGPGGGRDGGTDIVWDRHYHVTLLSDRRTRAMYDSLGVGDRVNWVETKTGYYGTDRTLRSVSNAIEFLKLPGLSLVDKVRLGTTIVWGSKIRDGHKMERLTVERWLRRWSGNQAFETFWKPLLRAKLGNEYPKASAAFIWATIQRLYAARRSGLKKEMFGYLSGGYRTVTDGFATWFADHGVGVRLSTSVGSVRRTPEGLEVTTRDGDGATHTDSFDKVIVTTAAPIAARLCPDLLDNERRRLESVQYLGIVCTSLLLRRPLAPYYLTYITDPDTPFTAVVEMTSFVDPAETGGHTLVYLPKYTTADDPLFAMDDAAVLDELFPFLAGMYPGLTRDDVITSRVSKVQQVFAVPSLGYSGSMPSIGTSVPGLYLAGSAHLPFATLNVDDTLSLVETVLAEARAPGTAS